MKSRIVSFALAAVALLMTACNKPAKPVNLVMHTSMGDIALVLYDQTPAHRDNFVALVEQNYFDSLLFHRVIEGFMIQGGDPDSRHAQPGQFLGEGGPNYTVEAEIRNPEGVVCTSATAGFFLTPREKLDPIYHRDYLLEEEE